MTRILVVEDETRIATFVAKGLTAAGYAVERADRGDDALALARQTQFDLVLLDVGLPGMDGFSVLRALRASGETVPVIMLTAHGSTADTVRGLDDGANDYVTKPFRFDELLARVRARVRESEPSALESTTRRVNGVELDILTRRVTVGDTTVELSAREFALADEFLRHPDQVLSREQLLSRVWGYDYDPGSNVVDVYVRYLRAKLGSERIQTVRGMGYRFPS